VLDFGISKVTNPSGSGADMGMTRTQAIMGSPLYMSPEQLASAKDVDQRTDVWAVGCVLYELVTGRVPFEAETMPQLCTLILHSEPPSPRSVRPDVPEGLDQAILRCLRKDRSQRYANVAALAADLAHFSPDAGPRSAERISRVLSSSGVSSPLLSSSNPATLSSGASTGAAWGNTQTSRGGRAVWYGLAFVAAAAIIAAVLWRATSAPPGPTLDPSGALAPSKPPSEPGTAAAAPPATATAAALPAENSARPSQPAPADSVAPAVSAAPALRPNTGKAKPVTAKPVAGKPKVLGEPSVDPLSERN
jgi:serine/threonine-protein kinase